MESAIKNCLKVSKSVSINVLDIACGLLDRRSRRNSRKGARKRVEGVLDSHATTMSERRVAFVQLEVFLKKMSLVAVL